MSDEKPENPTSSTVTEGVKKKRGRPKKQPQEDGGDIPQDAVEPQPVKKPRGRPKGSKKVTGLTGGMAEPAAGKKRRGRPRKWPQAVIQGEESQGGDPLENSDWNLNTSSATQEVEVEEKEGRKSISVFPRSHTSEIMVTGTGITGKDGSKRCLE